MLTNREIKLVVAKCWNQNSKTYFTVPPREPVQPIDPEIWLAHTEAVRGEMPMPRPMSRSTLSSSSLSSTVPANDCKFMISSILNTQTNSEEE